MSLHFKSLWFEISEVSSDFDLKIVDSKVTVEFKKPISQDFKLKLEKTFKNYDLELNYCIVDGSKFYSKLEFVKNP